MKPTCAIVFCFFTGTTPPKKFTTEWPVEKQRQDEHKVSDVWSMGVLFFYEEKFRCQHRWSENTSQKNVNIRLIFQTLSFIFPKWYVFCLQLYVWLESCDQVGSFGTKISGSLIVSPVLWVLSSRNTLYVTHSDTAS